MNWDGDGDDDPGYIRTAPGKQFFVTNPSHTPGGIEKNQRFGTDTDNPVVGAWGASP